MNREEAIDKVRKLLALNEGSGATTAEAANAAAAATQLMERYRLASAEVEAPEEEDEAIVESAPLVEGKRLQGWFRMLVGSVCVHNSCRSLLRSGMGMSRLLIVGRTSDVAVTEYMITYLRREIDRLAAQHVGMGRSYLNSFRLGAAVEVRKRLEAARLEARRDATTMAIVRVDARADEVADWCKTSGFKTTNFRPRTADQEGYEKGRRAGATIPLNPGIEGSSPVDALPKHRDGSVFELPGGGDGG